MREKNLLKDLSKRWKETIHLADYGRLQSYNNSLYCCYLLVVYILVTFFWLHFVESVAFRCCFAQSNSVLAQYKSKPRLSENKTEKEEEITLHSYVWIKFIEIFSKSPFGRFIIHLLYICNSYSYEFHKTHFNCDIKVNIFRILWGFVCIQYENRQSINHNFDCFGVFLNIFSLVVGALKVFFVQVLWQSTATSKISKNT